MPTRPNLTVDQKLETARYLLATMSMVPASQRPERLAAVTRLTAAAMAQLRGQ